MDFDLSEARALSLDLGRLADEALPEARKVVQRGALNIKKQMQTEAQGIGSAPGLPSDISYETQITPGGISADIGPTRGDVGSLALLYFGNSKTGPVLPDPVYALEREAPTVVEYLARIGVKL